MRILNACAALMLVAVAAPAFADADENAERNYVLTVDKLAEYRAFTAAMKQMEENPTPALKAEMASMGDSDSNETLAQAVEQMRKSPTLVAVIHRAGLTEADTVLIPLVAITAGMAASVPAAKRGDLPVSAANIAFVQQHRKEVEGLGN